jgi:hypothetical protein
MDEVGLQTWCRIILLIRGLELERNCGGGSVSDERSNQALGRNSCFQETTDPLISLVPQKKAGIIGWS